MKADILLDAIGMIQEETIWEAKSVRKAKKYSLTKWVVVAACLCVVGVTAVAAPTLQEFFYHWGNVMSEETVAGEKPLQLYAVGENIFIYDKDVELAKNFYILNGVEEQDAWKQAFQYVAEREVLYREALLQGYEVTEQEVKEYIEELKAAVNSAENKEDVQTVINQFGSAEEYWNYQYSIYEKNLPIQKLVKDKEWIFKQENLEAGDADWQEYFTHWKAELVAQENFQIVEK